MTNRITLRKFRMSDLDSILKLFRDKDILKNIYINKKVKEITKKYEEGWLKKLLIIIEGRSQKIIILQFC